MVELDGDEMTRIIWHKIKSEVRFKIYLKFVVGSSTNRNIHCEGLRIIYLVCTQNVLKSKRFLHPDTHTCEYQGGDVSFLKRFAYVVNRCSHTITEIWLVEFPLPLINCFREAKNNIWHAKVVNEWRVVENTTMLEETRNKITIF